MVAVALQDVYQFPGLLVAEHCKRAAMASDSQAGFAALIDSGCSSFRYGAYVDGKSLRSVSVADFRLFSVLCAIVICVRTFCSVHAATVAVITNDGRHFVVSPELCTVLARVSGLLPLS